MENLFVENQIRMYLVDPNVLAQIVQELTTKNMNYYLHNTEFFFFVFFLKYTYYTFSLHQLNNLILNMMLPHK